MFDVIVIGGSYAGMQAAMMLARGRSSVLVIDAGERRNRFAHASHGLIGRDGLAPGDIAAQARTQLVAYPEVTWIDARVETVGGEIDAFAVKLSDGSTRTGRRIIMATGVVDILPDLPGLAEQWGTGAAACPYCHGYELERGAIGVLATGPASLHHAMMLPQWGATTFFTNGAIELDDAQRLDLSIRGAKVDDTPVMSISGEPGSPVVNLAGGRAVQLRGLFVATRIRLPGDLATQLGCALQDGPFGQIIAADEMRQTSVPGVFACGDAARFAASVAFSIGDGAMAGSAAH
ncbi:MAG: NAD(P)/FAD-dependent oxidoreductase, partial [Mesorhizobium sp.]